MGDDGTITPLSVLADEEQKKAELLSALQSKAMEEAYAESSPQLTKKQGLSALATGLLPVLVGALMNGKRGAGIGAQAGALGTASYFKGIEQDQALARERAKAQASVIGDMRKSALSNASIAERQGARALTSKQLGLNGGTSVSVNLPKQDQPIPVNAQTKIDRFVEIANSAGYATNAILDMMPDALKKTYTDDSGRVDLNKAIDVIKERFKAAAFGGETNTGQVLNQVKVFTAEYLRSISGAAMTEPEYERLKSIVETPGLLNPSSIPTILKNIDSLRGKYEAAAKSSFATYQTLSTAGRTEKDLDKLFKSQGGPTLSERASLQTVQTKDGRVVRGYVDGDNFVVVEEVK